MIAVSRNGLLVVTEGYLFKNPAQECWSIVAGLLCLLHGAVVYFFLTLTLKAAEPQWLVQMVCIAVIMGVEVAAYSATLSDTAFKLSLDGLIVYKKSELYLESTYSDPGGELLFWFLLFPFFVIAGGRESTVVIPWESIVSVSQAKGLFNKLVIIEFGDKMQAGAGSTKVIRLPLGKKEELRTAVFHLAPKEHPLRDFCEKELFN